MLTIPGKAAYLESAMLKIMSTKPRPERLLRRSAFRN